MFRKITILCMFLSFFCFQENIANAQNVDKEHLTSELMKESGLNQHIVDRPNYLKDAIARNYKHVFKTNDVETSKSTEQLKSIVSVSFRPEIIKNVIATYIEAELSTKDIKAVLKWLNSPLGKKITRMEVESSTPKAYEAMIIFQPILKQQNDYKERVELIKKLLLHMKATEATLKAELNNHLSGLTIISSAFPSMQLKSAEAIKKNFITYSLSIRKNIETELIMNALYTYRQLKLDEIESYINFVKTDYGQRYHEIVHEGIKNAASFCAKQFAINVGKSLRKDSIHKFNRPDIQSYPQRK